MAASTAKKVNVKKGDLVVVLTGKNRGKRGKVLRVLPREGKVLVEGVNVVKKHQKPTQKIMQGGIIDMEAPVDASNVMLVCSKCHKPTRAGKKVLASGKSVRVCKNCDEVIDR